MFFFSLFFFFCRSASDSFATNGAIEICFVLYCIVSIMVIHYGHIDGPSRPTWQPATMSCIHFVIYCLFVSWWLMKIVVVVVDDDDDDDDDDRVCS